MVVVSVVVVVVVVVPELSAGGVVVFGFDELFGVDVTFGAEVAFGAAEGVELDVLVDVSIAEVDSFDCDPDASGAVVASAAGKPSSYETAKAPMPMTVVANLVELLTRQTPLRESVLHPYRAGAGSSQHFASRRPDRR